jgi:hypothetical protein
MKHPKDPVRGLAWIRTAFLALGVAGVVAGVGTALYTALSLRPRVSAITSEVRMGLQEADRTTAALAEHTEVIGTSVQTLQAAQRTLAAVPPILDRTRALLQRAAVTTTFMGEAVREIESGVTGIVAPDEELERTRAALDGTVDEMRDLAAALAPLSTATASLAEDLRGLSEEIAEASAAVGAGPPESAVLPATRARLQGMDESLAYLDAPRQTVLVGVGFGALLFCVGLFSLVIGAGIGPLMASMQASREADGSSSRAA